MEIYTPHHRKVLVLDSHALSDYQICPARFDYSCIKFIQPNQKKAAFSKGTVISTLLENYYKAKMAGTLDKHMVVQIVAEHLNPTELDKDTKELIEMRFYRYWQMYRKESWIPLAVETGFSEVLYEDENYLFIYEGRPDLIAKASFNGPRLVADHKSQSREYKIYPHNNQAKGYCTMNKIDFFVYNYFGLQIGGDNDKWFHRQTVSFSKEQIEDWKQETIKWYHRILTDHERLRSWRCESKFGICEFHPLCETTENWVREDKIRREFKKKEFRSWNSGESVEEED